MIHIRMDNKAKKQALPFAVKTPNAETRAAMERVERMAAMRKHSSFANIEELFEILDVQPKKE